MSPEERDLSVVIIGGGASGVLLATHLLRQRGRPVHVKLVEKRARLGRGVAYSALQHDHTLNV
ncbi:MAG TPA: FAD/NAD(P)-binding protein, partial [Devosia sp.]|nr:FAD/NAD(P)-binding protein [Devosia sp.]